MLEVKITIEAPGLESAINALAAAICGVKSAPVNTTPIQKVESAPAESQDTLKTQPETQADTRKTEDPKPETTDTTNTTDPAPEYTLEQVRAELAALSQEGKQAQVKKIITDAGAKKLTEIPPEKYADVMKAAGEVK